ncbi:MAG TPA: uracil phosphoribosyltransferase [Candidatus Enterosoma merdigallinarum]|mgnify:CR=1 FL=1|nr:uracil phosphoribosyltransferase [Candidatus Enterosoma merdigallinarum]
MEITDTPNVILLDHPLLKHKITLLRKKETGTNEFRRLVKEIAVLEGYEALRGLKTELIEVETPIETAKEPVISGKKLCFVPILRAGLGMVDGMLELVPSAKVGHIGLYRDETTHEPHEYFCKLPGNIEDREVFVLDPMLATGGSAKDAIKLLKERGARKITFICIIAAPEGVRVFHEAYPDIPLYIGALDRCLNENAYICPGLGDAGDRIFGTLK